MSPLHELFAELRAHERSIAPPYHRPDRLKPVRTLRPAIAYALMLVVVAMLANRPERKEPPLPTVTLNYPTDFLLKTPQSELLTTVPQFGQERISIP